MNRTIIIAEAGVNHNGSEKLAKDMVDVAKECGADYVKFQSFVSELLVSKHAPKAQYQMASTDPSESQYEMLKKLEITFEVQRELQEYCNKVGIGFLSTPFENTSLKFLVEELKVNLLKVASSDITNLPMLIKLGRSGVKSIISTGMSTLAEIESALSHLAFGYLGKNEVPTKDAVLNAYMSSEGQGLLKENVTLLHCVAEYPSPFNEMNLLNIQTLKSMFGLRTGFSDHSPGIVAPVVACALGAEVIEKHFTLDCAMEGPDHKASLSPRELKDMIAAVRNAEQSLGHGHKFPRQSEFRNRAIARKSIVASTGIKRGEVFTEENLDIKRPATGMDPLHYWDVLGTVASKDYNADDLITERVAK